jgi:ATP-binding cassette, subfamily B, bacterial HlyB/CyaB
MTYTQINPALFLADIAPFNQLSPSARQTLAARLQPFRYRIGQPIVLRDRLPAQIHILYEGTARLLGYDPGQSTPITLQRLAPGAILGAVGWVRGVACEAAIAATESTCLTLNAPDFLEWLSHHAEIAAHFQAPSLIEVFDVAGRELHRRADRTHLLQTHGVSNLKDFASLIALPQACTAAPDQPLSPDWDWFVSGGPDLLAEPVGDRYTAQTAAPGLRVLGFPRSLFSPGDTLPAPSAAPAPAPPLPPTAAPPIPYAPATPPEAEIPLSQQPASKYPYIKGQGPVETTVACFHMLAQHHSLPFRRDTVRKVILTQQDRTGSTSLQFCGAVAELMGLQAQLVKVPRAAIGRLPLPALIRYGDSPAVLYEANTQQAVLGIPEIGVVKRAIADLLPPADGDDAPPEEEIAALLLQPTRDTPQQKFGLSWFLPSLYKYRRILVEVFVASFFVQLFGLANPLITQVIIDKVLVQNSPNTLQVLGIFLIVIALFEAVLTSLRTYLFVDTTNRIDLALGAEIIDHLLRLPLRYFERRPVGELATRVNELENIRQFLTGTALTVVLDAVFSVIYIVVMFIYSWLLTIVALVTLPLFALLTTIVSPIVRRQLRVKAERNAEAQSHLVEVLSGIQTVKAQNIEMRSRWKWQERYARYVSAGFKTTLTFTAASSTSNFLNQLSSLLVLWVGAYLVLQGQLTLGQLIAFRIIAGYVTSPLLRLTQLWQNFQETALSLERLSDIIDSPVEADALDRSNIPMPTIQGHVAYENVSFRFNPAGPLQLNNVSVSFPAGQFVAIVGQSGSGKSTLMKLLPRLYPLESGRILIDGYDINKVELYSLRQQIGIVPQDTLLFDGTVQENIALNHPDATPEEIIAAAKIAVAHEFIMGLPNGYNTRVGERGASLSGGQRQRVAIARTILQNPNLLVMDEATSALDYDSERQVCLNLAAAFRDRTVFFITHRLSTIRNADHILMMDQGLVVEQGTHTELMALKGRYFCLYQQQESQM